MIPIEIQIELDNLKSFARAVILHWPESGIDGDELQDIAVNHGLLKTYIRHENCSVEGVSICQCAEYCTEEEFKKGVECFRKTDLLK